MGRDISFWLFYSECLKWYVSSYNVLHKMASLSDCSYSWLALQLNCQTHSPHLTAGGSITSFQETRKQPLTQSPFYISDRTLWQHSNFYIVIVAIAFTPVASGCWIGFQERELSTLIVRFDPFLKSHPSILFAHDSHLSCWENCDSNEGMPLHLRQRRSHRKCIRSCKMIS